MRSLTSTGQIAESEELSVLLIEENSEDARRFEECLRESGQKASFHRAPSLAAGLSQDGERRPDVLAYGLQNGEEVEVLNTIGANLPGVPVVMLTDSDTLEGAFTVRKAGAAEYLRKGDLSPALLGRTIRWAAERAQFQGKLRQRDAWIRSITESNAGGVFRADPAGRIQYANQALADLLGFAREEELVGLDLKSLYADPKDRGRLLAEDGAEEAEVEFKCPDGSTFMGHVGVEPARGNDGHVLHYDGFLVDITDRKQREEELRREKERFEALVQEVKEYAIFMLDREGHVRSWNEGAERIKGYSRGGDHRRAVFDVLHRGGEEGRSSRRESRAGRGQRECYGRRLARSCGRFAVLGPRDDNGPAQ